MISEFYKEMTGKESVIRQFFDFARARAAEMGPESVFNFSIGNPSVPTTQSFTDAIIDITEKGDPVKIHGYSPTLGQDSTKKAIADSLNRRFGMNYTAGHIFPTSGAAGALAGMLFFHHKTRKPRFRYGIPLILILWILLILYLTRL